MSEIDSEVTTIQPNYQFDRINAAVAFAVFLFTLVVYYLTMAPTFSFWDCGEFIACSYILGIPHPPGTPLYVLIGRIFSIIPMVSDIAARVNLFSSVTGAFSAMFGYLVLVRILRFWYKDRSDIYNRIIIYIGGFTGALFMAFSNTHWTNSVEAEVYSPAIMLMTIIYWLTLKYFENKETPTGSRYVLLILYLAMLGVGIHLTLFLIVPILGLYFVLKKESSIRDWTAISLFFLIELYLIFQLSSRPGEIPYYLPVLILFIIFVFHSVLLYKNSRPFMITLGLYLAALYPLYFVIVESIYKKMGSQGLTPTLQTVSDLPIGWIGFGGLVLWGLYTIIRYYSMKDRKNDGNEWLIPAVYSLAPAVLLGLGQVFSGYVSFLFLTAIIVLLIALVIWRQVNWLILIGLGVISLIILGFWKFVFGIIFGAVLIIIVGLVKKNRSWKTALAIILLAVIGFSVHLYLPIQSEHSPRIDENDPSSSTAAFINLLERKQYGNVSMTERMFTRRAEWANQFGDYQRMGFWRFFEEQYGLTGSGFFIILILGLFGIWETIRRKPDIGLPFLIIVLLSSVGLILYMNFADGTRINQLTGMDYLEVRNRDYFFTPAFVFFGLAIGLGIAGIIDLIKDTFARTRIGVNKTVFGLSALLVLLPLIPLTGNYFYNDRSRNYMPYDYSSNVLKSCDKDAILITAGDNDTFPMWCIQEVYDYRKDVRVINLSLSNMGWYIRQLRDVFNVPILWTDEQIDRLVPYRDGDGTVFKVQHQVIDHIINANKWKYPIYFIVSAGENNLRYRGKPLMDHLMLEGLVFRLMPTKGQSELDLEKTSHLYEEVYSYRGVVDPTIYKNETTLRITENYSQGILFMADSLRKAKDYDKVFEYIDRSQKLMVDPFDAYVYTAQILGEMGRLDTLDAFMDNAAVSDKRVLYFNWALSAKLGDRLDDAITVFLKTLQLYPHYTEAFRSLVGTLYQSGRYGLLRRVVTEWVEYNPDDMQAQQLLTQIKDIDPTLDTAEGDN